MNAFLKAAALAGAAASLATALPASAAPAFAAQAAAVPMQQAQAWNYGPGRDRYDYSREDYRRGYRDPYAEPVSRDTRVWRDRDGRTYCRKRDGTTGLIVGGAVGALAGRAIDGGRDRTLGTILGAVGGALLGREVDRSSGTQCR